MPIERTTRNVSDVITAVKRQFGDESGQQITTPDIIRWVNDAQREVVLHNTEVNAALVKINVVANQSDYPLLTNIPDIMTIHSVHFNGQILRNMSFVKAQEYIIQSNDTQTAACPSFWYEYAGVMHLWPIPANSQDAGITVFYSTFPASVADSGSLLSVPDTYFKAIVDFCMQQAYELDENFPAAQAKGGQFDVALQVQANRQRSEDNQYPTITLLPEDYS